MEKHLKLKFFVLCLLLGVQCISAQKTAVTGTVVSDQNEPLIGVTISEVGTNNGVITDLNGRFSIILTNGGG